MASTQVQIMKMYILLTSNAFCVNCFAKRRCKANVFVFIFILKKKENLFEFKISININKFISTPGIELMCI